MREPRRAPSRFNGRVHCDRVTAQRLTRLYALDRTTPPSVRTAAPLMAAASGLQTKATTATTSSGAAKRCRMELGGLLEKLLLEDVMSDALFRGEPVYKFYDPL